VNWKEPPGLCEAKVLAAGCHGGVEGLAEIFVRLVLGEVKLCDGVSNDQYKGQHGRDARLKQVWLEGRRSLLP
jgi:hypothetical protein